MRRLLPVLVAGVALFGPRPAHAQATVVVTPSVELDGAYDSNVLWRPNGLSDEVWRLSPSLNLLRDTPRSSWLLDLAVDAEWYARHTDLSTPLARQHAALEGRTRPTTRTRFELMGGYDSSVRPSELNVATGLIPGRVRGTRWFGATEAGYDITPRTELSGRVQSAGEETLSLNAFIQDLEARVDHEASDRNGFHARYLTQFFTFETGSVTSQAGVAGWTRRITPAVQLVLEGGVRHAAGRFRPEIEASGSYRRTYSDLRLSYIWTQTTALGVLTPVETQRAGITWRYARPRVIGGSLDASVHLNELSDERTDVYRFAAEIVKPVMGPLSIATAWSLDHQRGRLIPLPGAGGSGLLVPILTDERITRHVLLVRVVVSGSTRSMSGPREPEAVRPGGDEEGQR